MLVREKRTVGTNMWYEIGSIIKKRIDHIKKWWDWEDKKDE